MASTYLLSCASTACWIVALIPQQWHNYCTQSVHGLSPYLLLLWLLGDSCNLIGCILTNQLPFQTYLSCYFVFNDIVLDFQYVYYTFSVPASRRRGSIELPPFADTPSTIEFTPDSEQQPSLQSLYTDTLDSPISRATSFVSPLSKSQIITTTTALLSVSPASATIFTSTSTPKSEEIGLFFAWLCTCVYCCSRLPQLYHNYTRKSVDGVSPLLFLFALMANVTYALSILLATVPEDLTFEQFVHKELPYLIGSLGTVLFDMLYFWQRRIYNVEP